MTLPKRGLKTRAYSIDMNKNIATLPKKGLKTRPYNIGMEKKGLKKYDYTMYMDMEKEYLKKLSKGQLIKLILKQKKSKKVSNHEDLLDNDQFKDEVAQEPAKRIKPPKLTRKPPPPPIPQVEDHIINVPVPKIKELNQALKGHAKSYGIELQDNLNPLNHFTKTTALIESHLENLLKDMKGFKFIATLEVTFMFEKDTIDSKTGKRVSIYKTAFFNGKAKTITEANDIEHELNMSRHEILNVIDKWVSEGSGWVIDRINSHYINVTTYTPLHGSSYIPMELKNPKKGLINIRNKDDECFRWCHIST